MCAVFGYLDYKGKVSNATLKKLIHCLSVAAEIRGIDATGISYVNHGKMITFKKPKPAHQVKLFFPKGTRAVIGHTRMTTQGSEKKNYNNHPFQGTCGNANFSLAHNGVLYNDKEIRTEKGLPQTHIETDSYIAVQLLEQENQLNAESIKHMAETVEGSFVFTILRDDNTLFLVKGSNPLTVYHFPQIGLYVYASTKSILEDALKKSRITEKFCKVDVSEGEILELSPDGKIRKNTFEIKDNFHSIFHVYNWCDPEYAGWRKNDERKEMLMEYCCMFGVDESDVQLLLDFGYDAEEIEEMLMDTGMLEEALNEAKALFKCEA